MPCFIPKVVEQIRYDDISFQYEKVETGKKLKKARAIVSYIHVAREA